MTKWVIHCILAWGNTVFCKVGFWIGPNPAATAEAGSVKNSLSLDIYTPPVLNARVSDHDGSSFQNPEWSVRHDRNPEVSLIAVCIHGDMRNHHHVKWLRWFLGRKDANDIMRTSYLDQSTYRLAVLGITALSVLYLISRYNYNLFHALADGASIVIAVSVFIIIWNTRHLLENDYLLHVGISFLFFALLDLLHVLGNKGMGVFPAYGNLGPALYIASRYVIGISLLIAPLFVKRKLNTSIVFTVYSLVTAFILLSIFYWHIFPVCVVEGVGLTPFKVTSDYIVCLILLGAIGLLLVNRGSFDSRVFWLIVSSLILSIATGMAFTLYADPFGITNAVGHFFQIASFCLVYLAIIETSLTKPQNILYRKLTLKEKELAENLKRLDHASVGLRQEITERKRAEEALRQSEERWAVTLASIGDAVIATDTDGRITFLNPVAEVLTGWPMAEAVGKRVQEVFRIVNEYSCAVVDDPVNKVLKAGRVVGLANHTVLLRKDGAKVPIDDSAAPIRDEAGHILGVVLIFRDISERRKVEKSLRQLNETLEQRVSERTELAHTRSRQLQALAVELITAEEQERRRISHILHDDLQQMLAAAKMQLQSVSDNLPNETILKNVWQILEDSLAKTRQLSHELSPTILHHSGLVAGLNWLSGQMNEQFGLTTAIETTADIVLDSAPLKLFLFRAVQELLFNIVKHAGVKHARIDLSSTNGCFAITVSDQGQGFDPEQMKKRGGGIGFGLLTIQERANCIGANLTIDSVPGKGSRFTLTVPHSVDKADQLPEPVAIQQACKPTEMVCDVGADVTRVLCVDDHKVMRQGLINLIDAQPCIKVVGEASNGREAIDEVAKLNPDVVLMDVSMPVMDGIEATRRIKAQWPQVRVIALSMHEDEHISRTMVEAGAEAFVGKTTSSAELLKAIFKIDPQKRCPSVCGSS